MTSKDDIEKYYKWTDEACDIIRDDPYKSYGLVKFQDNIWKVPIDYYAKCNPRSNQEARLPELLQYFLKEYVVH